MSEQQANNPLHGVTLEQIVNSLVEYYGWDELGKRIDIRCFNNDPSVKSSLKFLRKTPWARKKVEGLYISTPKEETVFERTYEYYLEQLRGISFESIAPKLGAKIEANALKIPLFKSDYEVSVEKITGPSGEKPTHDICVILSKYLLLCPDKSPENNDWVSFRNFKDSGPLINYFTNDVERTIASYFSEKLADLKKASNKLGGYPPFLDAKYDFSIQFDALPMVPVIMLYNDMDEEFSAKCYVLFESRAENFLDAECIAMLGRQLFSRLRKALK